MVVFRCLLEADLYQDGCFSFEATLAIYVEATDSEIIAAKSTGYFIPAGCCDLGTTYKYLDGEGHESMLVGDALLHLSEHDDEFIGSVLVFDRLSVLNEYRRKGFGSSLVSEVTELLVPAWGIVLALPGEIEKEVPKDATQKFWASVGLGRVSPRSDVFFHNCAKRALPRRRCMDLVLHEED